jgi:hypothetical protein
MPEQNSHFLAPEGYTYVPAPRRGAAGGALFGALGLPLGLVLTSALKTGQLPNLSSGDLPGILGLMALGGTLGAGTGYASEHVLPTKLQKISSMKKLSNAEKIAQSPIAQRLDAWRRSQGMDPVNTPFSPRSLNQDTIKKWKDVTQPGWDRQTPGLLSPSTKAQIASVANPDNNDQTYQNLLASAKERMLPPSYESLMAQAKERMLPEAPADEAADEALYEQLMAQALSRFGKGNSKAASVKLSHLDKYQLLKSAEIPPAALAAAVGGLGSAGITGLMSLVGDKPHEELAAMGAPPEVIQELKEEHQKQVLYDMIQNGLISAGGSAALTAAMNA